MFHRFLVALVAVLVAMLPVSAFAEHDHGGNGAVIARELVYPGWVACLGFLRAAYLGILKLLNGFLSHNCTLVSRFLRLR